MADTTRTDKAPEVAARPLSKWEQHRFFVLIAIVTLISLFLVSVALSLYNTSGAAQLDLSRPGYQNVRKNAVQEEGVVSYPSSGELDKAALDQFLRMYDERAKKTSTKSFDPSAMSDTSLQLIDSPTAETEPPTEQ